MKRSKLEKNKIEKDKVEKQGNIFPETVIPELEKLEADFASGKLSASLFQSMKASLLGSALESDQNNRNGVTQNLLTDSARPETLEDFNSVFGAGS